MRNRFCFLISVLVLLSLTGCKGFSHLRISFLPVISKSDADFPIPDGHLLYPVFSGENLAAKYSSADFAGLASQKQISELRNLKLVPDVSKVKKFSIVEHCYRYGKQYLALEELYNNFYVGSVSTDGCFDKSNVNYSELAQLYSDAKQLDKEIKNENITEQKKKEIQSVIEASFKIHLVYLFKVIDGNIHSVAFDEKIGKSDIFEKWAHRQTKAVKWWHGIYSERQFNKDEKTGEVKESLFVFVSDTSAYTAFLKDNSDSIIISSRPELWGGVPTQRQKEAFALTQSIDAEQKRLVKAAEAEKKRIAQEKAVAEAEKKRIAKERALAEVKRERVAKAKAIALTKLKARLKRLKAVAGPSGNDIKNALYRKLSVAMARLDAMGNQCDKARSSSTKNPLVAVMCLMTLGGQLNSKSMEIHIGSVTRDYCKPMVGKSYICRYRATLRGGPNSLPLVKMFMPLGDIEGYKYASFKQDAKGWFVQRIYENCTFHEGGANCTYKS